MSNARLRTTRDILSEAFPEVAIDGQTVQCNDIRDLWQIQTELSLSGIAGLTWPEISLLQARGTWDVLDLVDQKLLVQLLPGYLQWLWEPEEADVMYSGLLRLLVASDRSRFTREQRVALRQFLVNLQEETAAKIEEAERALLQETLSLYGGEG